MTTPRKYHPADDSLFFARIKAGTLRVDTEQQAVFARRSHRSSRWIRIAAQECKNGYLHVRAYLRGKRKSIALHRLIFLVHNGIEQIPAGMNIDHFPDRSHQNNHPSNLRLRDAYENSCDNGRSIPDDF